MDVRSQGDSALFVGDILHHPAQVYHPEWNSPFCEDQSQARVTRRNVLADAADRGALLLPAHFGGVHCCRVRRRGESFEPVFEVDA
jgi:glyoxylase-like metal-dependent hydrolase (beta-lactamase superfamily II)